MIQCFSAAGALYTHLDVDLRQTALVPVPASCPADGGQSEHMECHKSRDWITRQTKEILVIPAGKGQGFAKEIKIIFQIETDKK